MGGGRAARRAPAAGAARLVGAALAGYALGGLPSADVVTHLATGGGTHPRAAGAGEPGAGNAPKGLGGGGRGARRCWGLTSPRAPWPVPSVAPWPVGRDPISAVRRPWWVTASRPPTGSRGAKGWRRAWDSAWRRSPPIFRSTSPSPGS